MVKPLCQYFNECAGCSSQHIDYSLQLENKKKLLTNLIHAEIKCFSGKEYCYRNRMELIFNSSKIGLRKKGKPSEIVDIEKCVICNDKVNVLIKEVRSFFMNRFNAAYRFAVIRATGYSSSISIILDSSSQKIKEAIEDVKEFSKLTAADNIVVTYIKHGEDEAYSDDYFILKGTDKLKEMYLGKEFFYPIQGFFQNNHEVAEKMHDYCHSLLKSYDTKKYSLLDLYSGVGVFAAINAPLFESVLLVESFKQSVECSKTNLKNNNVVNADVHQLDAKQIKKIQFKNDLFVITDPPRSGMDMKTIEALKRLKPGLILYISCNPFQLKKDILKFKDYQIKSAAMFDMFPQTNHIETVIELVRTD